MEVRSDEIAIDGKGWRQCACGVLSVGLERRPEACRNMTELREVIDALDGKLIALLAQRVACIDRAVALKKSEGLPARIEDRVQEVIGKVRVTAKNAGVDADLAETLWRDIIEWSIAREERALDAGEGDTP